MSTMPSRPNIRRVETYLSVDDPRAAIAFTKRRSGPSWSTSPT